jgi:hypothetical protein
MRHALESRNEAGSAADHRALPLRARGNGGFSQALRELAARDLTTPCSADEISHLWLSELAGERRQAAKWCRSSPLIAECGEAASARQERFGVFSGIDRTKNPSGRPRK